MRTYIYQRTFHSLQFIDEDFLALWILMFVFMAMYFCPYDNESLSLHISNCVVICFQKSVFLWLRILSGPVVGCWWLVDGGQK